MKKLSQKLYITYSNQRVRDLKSSSTVSALDKIITLDNLLLELYQRKNFHVIIDKRVASSIIYNIIQVQQIQYFSYLEENAASLDTIYSFIVKCNRNNIAFETLLSSEKLDAIVNINNAYQDYKQAHHLVDISDIEQSVLEHWDNYFTNAYDETYIDSFKFGDISYIKSQKQEKILDKLSPFNIIENPTETSSKTKIIKPSNEVFDNIDEVKTAIKIARKLLEDGENADNILIVASDIQEYAPFYKLFLDEYEIKGFSSIGTPLSSFYNSSNPKVQIALNDYKSQIGSLTALYEKLGLNFGETAKESIKASISILDDKIGIELTEPNQVVGLGKRYKHIIFIGTDINHFPPKASDNFLYSYEDDIQYFYANNYFTSSQTQYNELKRLSDNLYIVTASYSDKRELTPSIIIDNNFDEIIDISHIKSVSELALENTTIEPEPATKQYYQSITSENLTAFDGNNVMGVNATHLSASQINKYLSCPLAYLYSNKIRLKAPKQTEEGFDFMEQGSLMHLCYELFGRYIKDDKGTTRNKKSLYKLMYSISIEAYHHKDTVSPRGKEKVEENIHHQIFLSTLQAGLEDDRKPGLLAKFVDYYIEKAEHFEYFKNSEFEKEFALDADLNPYQLTDNDDRNYFIKGYIDRFDNLHQQINIIDYKSKKMSSVIDKDKQEQIAELKDVQLALYLLFASQEYPNKAYYSHLLSFKGKNASYHFANLSNIEQTNTALYDNEYEIKLKKVIFDTKANIENGHFGFDNRDEKVCGYCDIKNICHESVLIKNCER